MNAEDTSKLRKYAIWFGVAILAAGAGQQVVLNLNESDLRLGVAKQLVSADPKVESVVGEVEDLKWRRTRTFYGEDGKEPYKEYQFSVSGSKSNALLTVRLVDSCESDYCFEVIRIAQ